jgi:hypothetical protein
LGSAPCLSRTVGRKERGRAYLMSTEEDPVALPAKVVAARKEREREV